MKDTWLATKVASAKLDGVLERAVGEFGSTANDRESSGRPENRCKGKALLGRNSMGLGRLRCPFIAGAAALLIAFTLMAPHIFWWLEPQPEQVFFGLLTGALASVGLYEVLRAIAERRMRAIAEE